MKGVYCIPLLSTYDEPVVYPSTIHRRYAPFPEQLDVNIDVLFSNVVQSRGGEIITLASVMCRKIDNFTHYMLCPRYLI